MDTREKISALERRYTELRTDVDKDKKSLRSKESELLELLQELMPLQNAFLGSVINNLQAKIRTLETEQDASISTSPNPAEQEQVDQRENNIES